MWKHRHHDSANTILAVVIVVGTSIMLLTLGWLVLILMEAVWR